MRRTVTAAGFVLLAWCPVSAGELVFANGTRLAGDLANEALLVSTGSGLVEIGADEILVLSRDEMRLRDGRVIRGTLVGGLLRARTALGEIAVKVDELDAYRASGAGTAAASAPAAPESQPRTEVAAVPAAAGQARIEVAAVPAVAGGRSDTAGFPAVASYQGVSPGPRPVVATATVPEARPPISERPLRLLQVVGETPLYRDAVSGSARIGYLAPGQHVTYLDSIDRRLRILNHLLFDGGHWVKVRLADGVEGWIPANSVRELR
jgi:hypothetical protein